MDSATKERQSRNEMILVTELALVLPRNQNATGMEHDHATRNRAMLPPSGRQAGTFQ